VVDDFKYRDKVVIGTCNYGEISVLWTRDILNTKVHSDGTRRHEISNWSEKKRSNFSCYWGMYVWSWGTRLVKQLVHDIASPRVLFDADFVMDRLQKLNELEDSENLALSSLVPMMSVWQRWEIQSVSFVWYARDILGLKACRLSTLWMLRLEKYMLSDSWDFSGLYNFITCLNWSTHSHDLFFFLFYF
jgi:hypothetical protein